MLPLKRTKARSGQPAPDETPAVVFEVPWTRLNVGWDILARAYARAMDEAGIHLRLYPSLLPEQRVYDKALGHLAAPCTKHSAYIFSTFFAEPSLLRQALSHHLLSKSRPRIFYTMFERLHVAKSTGAFLNQIEGVWVPCTANRDALLEAGARNAKWIPVPYFDDDLHLRLPPPKQARAFYWIGAWEPRKAPDVLIRAFMTAFKPGEASLTLKIGGMAANWPGPDIQAPWRDSIQVRRDTLSSESMVSSIHGQGDVYVSASRGEGVDMPAFAAKLAGRRVVTTDSGGPRDFLGEHDILVPATGEILTHPMYNWEPGSSNADYRFDDLVAALQRARSEPVKPRDLPNPETFGSHAVGRTLKNWLEELADHSQPSS